MSERCEYRVTFTAREKAELVEFNRPAEALGPAEVEGRTLVTLISAGTELNGAYVGDQFPCAPGYAAVFEVESVGAEVKDLAPGDRVFCPGNHQSYQRTTREKALPLPAGLAPETAVFARMMGVSMSTLTTAAARPPAKVLITGLGAIGHLAAKIFAISGYDVTACDPSESRRAIALRNGIPRALPAVPLDDPEFAGCVDLVVECSGHEQAALDGCRIIRKRGEVVLIGVPWRRKTDLFAFDILQAVFQKYAVVRSGWEWELPLQPTDFRMNSICGNWAAALRWLAEKRLSVDGLYEKVPPREAQKAYQDLLHGRSSHLVTLFDWRAAR